MRTTVIILTIFGSLLISCSNSSKKALAQHKDSINVNLASVSNTNSTDVVLFDPISKDTSINEFRIKYSTFNNSRIVTRSSKDHSGKVYSTKYSDQSVRLNVKYSNIDVISDNVISIDDFKKNIPVRDLPKLVLTCFEVDKTEKDTLYFFVSITEPDTDYAYFFDLLISRSGSITIKEKELTNDEW